MMYFDVIHNKNHIDETLKKNVVSNEIIENDDNDIIMMNSMNYEIVDREN